MSMIKYSQSTQSKTLSIFLQYVKKEDKDGDRFLHVDRHQSFYKLAFLFMMEMARHVQST